MHGAPLRPQISPLWKITVPGKVQKDQQSWNQINVDFSVYVEKMSRLCSEFFTVAVSMQLDAVAGSQNAPH